MKDEKIVYEFPSIHEITCDIFAGFDEEDSDPDSAESGKDIDKQPGV